MCKIYLKLRHGAIFFCGVMELQAHLIWPTFADEADRLSWNERENIMLVETNIKWKEKEEKKECVETYAALS